MKKVIVLCSALVFEFLPCSEVSAADNTEISIDSVNVSNAKSIIENKLTELLNIAGEETVKKRIQEFYDTVKSPHKKGWKAVWVGSPNITIKDNEVKFVDSKSNAYRLGLGRIQSFLKSVQKEIDQYKATRNNKQQVLNELQSRGNNRVFSRRNFAGNLSDRRGFVQNRVQQFEQNSSENDLKFDGVGGYHNEGLPSNGSSRNSRVPSRSGSISSLSSSSTPYSSAESLDSESSKSRGSLSTSRLSSRRNSVGDLIEKFEQNGRRSFHRALSADNVSRPTRSSYRSNSIDGIDKQNVKVNVDQFRPYNATPSTIDGIPVVEVGAIDKGGSANNSRRNSVHDLIQQFEQNSTGSSPRSSVNNLSSGSSSVKDFARKFESGADEYVEDYYSEGLSSNGSTRNSRVPSRRNSTINGVPVVDGGRYATIDEGSDASSFEVKEGATLGEKTAERINQLRNSASNSRRSSVNNLNFDGEVEDYYIEGLSSNVSSQNSRVPSRRKSVQDLIQQFEQNSNIPSRRNSMSNLSDRKNSVNNLSLRRSISEGGLSAKKKEVMPYDSGIITSNPAKHVQDELKNLRDLMNEGEKIPSNSTAYLSQDDINEIEHLLATELAKKDSSWSRKVYSKNKLDSYIKEAIVNYLRSKAPAVALPKNIDKLDGNKQKDQIKAKQLIENMLTSTYKYFLGYDPKYQYQNWQSWGAKDEIKEIVRLFVTRLNVTWKEKDSPIDVKITDQENFLGRRSITINLELKTEEAKKLVGNADAIKLLYEIIHEKETELRSEFIMNKLNIYKDDLKDADASNYSLSTSSSTSRRNSTSTNASNDSLSTSDYDDYSM